MKTQFPEPAFSISKIEARRFILSHQSLLPPRQLSGKTGILEFIRHTGCIQYDPINIVGRNPDLVLQSRIMDYRPGMLTEILYSDRKLLDGWDKMMSIYPLEDRPFFERNRIARKKYYEKNYKSLNKIYSELREIIAEKGPVSSLDLKINDKINWSWSPTRVSRAALESMYFQGELVVFNRINTRRIYDFASNLLPEKILSQSDPNKTLEEYRDWHLSRRIGGMGLADPKGTDCWLGIYKTKSKERAVSLTRLTNQNKVIPVAVNETPGRTYFLRACDLPTLRAIQKVTTVDKEVSIIGALDNFMWDRQLLKDIFDFDYTWEVYKPVEKRKYGYYVLPVLYGDRFIARFEPKFNKKTGELILNNWWWEDNIEVTKDIENALILAFGSFFRYLNGNAICLGSECKGKHKLKWVKRIK